MAMGKLMTLEDFLRQVTLFLLLLPVLCLNCLPWICCECLFSCLNMWKSWARMLVMSLRIRLDLWTRRLWIPHPLLCPLTRSINKPRVMFPNVLKSTIGLLSSTWPSYTCISLMNYMIQDSVSCSFPIAMWCNNSLFRVFCFCFMSFLEAKYVKLKAVASFWHF